MKQRYTLKLLLSICLLVLGGQSIAQNVGGFWLGVAIPNNPIQAGYQYYNYSMRIIQSGTTLSGSTLSSNPSAIFGGQPSNLAGSITASMVTFAESDVTAGCFWQGKLTYDPVNESLIGTYEYIITPKVCERLVSGTIELYRIALKSGDTICRGSLTPPVVTGKNIRWYSSTSKSTLLAQGNTYSTPINQTTTFYITQTLYNQESPPVPITITVIDPIITLTPANTGCDKNNGSLVVKATPSTGWQYNINGSSFQSSPVFTSLKPGSYTVVAKATTGCQTSQVATIPPESGPTISTLISKPPNCATANGQVSVVAEGGKVPLRYSIDYGVTYQSSATFTNLVGRTYTFRVRDDNGCEVNQAISLPPFTPMTVAGLSVTPTSCGQDNGQATFTTTGGIKPVKYSLDSQSFQVMNTFTALKAGTYTLVARDSSGCTLSQAIRIAASIGPQVTDVQVTKASCGLANGTILVTSLRPADQYSYSLNGLLIQSSGSFTNLQTGSYALSIRDNQGCSLNQSVSVLSDCVNTIQIPSAFSPNRDNYNDALTMHFPFASVQIVRFTVYDRWGAVVCNRANFALASGDPLWDGQSNGQVLPVGIYVYRMDCQFPDGTQTTYRESVSILN